MSRDQPVRARPAVARRARGADDPHRGRSLGLSSARCRRSSRRSAPRAMRRSPVSAASSTRPTCMPIASWRRRRSSMRRSPRSSPRSSRRSRLPSKASGAFHEAQKPEAMWLKEIRPGVFAGERTTPIPSVACYVPRGKGAFPSVMMMTTIPAVIAGVPRDRRADAADAGRRHRCGDAWWRRAWRASSGSTGAAARSRSRPPRSAPGPSRAASRSSGRAAPGWLPPRSCWRIGSTPACRPGPANRSCSPTAAPTAGSPRSICWSRPSTGPTARPFW